jgi:hypothetical protein
LSDFFNSPYTTERFQAKRFITLTALCMGDVFS